MKECHICKRIKLIRNGKSSYLVEEVPVGFWVLGDNQFYRGYSLVLLEGHVEHLHQLPFHKASEFLTSLTYVGKRLFEILQPERINYEILCNKDHHVHAHIIPRYKTDPKPESPVWNTPQFRNETFNATVEQLKELKMKLQ